MADDPIKNLLLSTGWSVQDLLQRVQSIKNINVNPPPANTNSSNPTCNGTVHNPETEPTNTASTSNTNINSHEACDSKAVPCSSKQTEGVICNGFDANVDTSNALLDKGDATKVPSIDVSDKLLVKTSDITFSSNVDRGNACEPILSNSSLEVTKAIETSEANQSYKKDEKELPESKDCKEVLQSIDLKVGDTDKEVVKISKNPDSVEISDKETHRNEKGDFTEDKKVDQERLPVSKDCENGSESKVDNDAVKNVDETVCSSEKIYLIEDKEVVPEIEDVSHGTVRDPDKIRDSLDKIKTNVPNKETTNSDNAGNRSISEQTSFVTPTPPGTEHVCASDLVDNSLRLTAEVVSSDNDDKKNVTNISIANKCQSEADLEATENSTHKSNDEPNLKCLESLKSDTTTDPEGRGSATPSSSSLKTKKEEQLCHDRDPSSSLLSGILLQNKCSSTTMSLSKKVTFTDTLMNRLCPKIVAQETSEPDGNKQQDVQESNDVLENQQSEVETDSSNTVKDDEIEPACVAFTDVQDEKLKSLPSVVEPVAGSTSTDTTYSVPLTAHPIKQEDSKMSSAFVSNHLDEFLSANADLNISYEVPQLKAGDSILNTVNMEHSYIARKRPAPVPRRPRAERVPRPPENKAKTLAEKRKMLGEQYSDEMEWIQYVGSATEEQKAKYREVNEKLLREDHPFTKRLFRVSSTFREKNSYVEYNSGKLKVVSKEEVEIVAKVHTRTSLFNRVLVREPEQIFKRKLLLNMPQANISNVSYKPGPLCKKQQLQIHHVDNEWSTELKPVPEVSLKVTPKFCKRVHYKAQPFIKFRDDGVLTEDQISYALTALKSDEVDSKSFTFPIKFVRGQEQMMLLKRNSTWVKSESKHMLQEPDEQIQEIVKTVVDKLLDYAEVSSMSPTINYDETADCPKDTKTAVHDSCSKDEKEFDEDGSTSPKRPKQCNRLLCELRRLNCRYFEVNVEEDKQEEGCTNDFCRLGCLCESLQCDEADLQQLHCGRTACMFKCTCNYQPVFMKKKISLPPGTDVAVGTIARLQDEAVRNLARAEKEFTHSVFKAKDQTIILGSDSDTKPEKRQRRVTRAPKKYGDFEESKPKAVAYESGTESSPTKYAESTTKQKKSLLSPMIKPCCVEIEKYNFDSIIPLCLVHGHYKCYCRYKATFGDETLRPSKNGLVDPPEEEILEPDTTEKRASSVIFKIERLPKPLKHVSRNNNERIHFILPNETRRIIKQRKLNSQLMKHKSMLMRKYKGIEHFRVKVVVKPNPSKSEDSAVNKEESKPDADAKNHKPSSGLLQEVRKIYSKNKNGRVDRSYRILKWSLLLQAFSKNKLDIWYTKTDGKEQLFISNIHPGSNFRNIREYQDLPREKIPNILVRWLVTGQLPRDSDKDVLFAIVRENKPHYEICGFCRKDLPGELNEATENAEQKNEGNDEEMKCETPSTVPEATVVSDGVKNGKRKKRNGEVNHRKVKRKATDTLTDDKSISKRKRSKKKPEITTTNQDSKSDTLPDLIQFSTAINNNAPEQRIIKTECNAEQTRKLQGLNNNKVLVTIKQGEVVKLTPACKIKQERETSGNQHNSKSDIDKQLATANKNSSEPNKTARAFYHCHTFQVKLLKSDDEIVEATLPTISNSLRWRGLTVPNRFKELMISKYLRLSCDVVRQLQSLSRTKQTTVELALGHHFGKRDFSVYFPRVRPDMIYIGPYGDMEEQSILLHTQKSKSNLENRYGKWYKQNVETIIIEPELAQDDAVELSDEREGEFLLNKDGSNSGITLIKTVQEPVENVASELVAPLQVNNDTQEKRGMKRISVTPLEKLISKKYKIDPLISSPDGADDDLEIMEEDRGTRQRKYIVTNIPNLGYLVGFQFPNSKIIDVQCPFGRITKRFSKMSAATLWLKKELNSRFLFLPEDMELTISMLDQLKGVSKFMMARAVKLGNIITKDGIKKPFDLNPIFLRKLGLDMDMVLQMLKSRSGRSIIFGTAESGTTDDLNDDNILNGASSPPQSPPPEIMLPPPPRLILPKISVPKSVVIKKYSISPKAVDIPLKGNINLPKGQGDDKLSKVNNSCSKVQNIPSKEDNMQGSTPSKSTNTACKRNNASLKGKNTTSKSDNTASKSTNTLPKGGTTTKSDKASSKQPALQSDNRNPKMSSILCSQLVRAKTSTPQKILPKLTVIQSTNQLRRPILPMLTTVPKMSTVTTVPKLIPVTNRKIVKLYHNGKLPFTNIEIPRSQLSTLNDASKATLSNGSTVPVVVRTHNSKLVYIRSKDGKRILIGK